MEQHDKKAARVHVALCDLMPKQEKKKYQKEKELTKGVNYYFFIFFFKREKKEIYKERKEKGQPLNDCPFSLYFYC